MSTNTIAAPAGQDAVKSHGTYTGQSNAAKVVLSANIATQELGNSLMVIFATMATQLADVQVAIQNQLAGIQQGLWDKYHMNDIQKKIDKKEKLTTDETQYISMYSTALGTAQSAIQAGTKGIDPVLTPTQNMPNALATSMKQQMDSCSTVIDGMKFVAQCKIA